MTERDLLAILAALHEKASEQIYDRVLNGARSIAEIEDILTDTLTQERVAVGEYLEQFGDSETVDRKWNDGKNYRDSLKESIERTRSDLERIFQEGMEIAEEAKEAFLNRRNYETETIAVTEETRVRAAMVQNMYPYYMFMTEEDSMVCPYCRPLNGLVFDTIDARVGDNLPPMHPRCRCRIKPMN